jgi:phage terminase large subunit-like protein
LPAIPAKWKKLIRLIPGYDPIATAGDCIFDIGAAQHAIDFFHECLRHVKGELAGKPLILERWEQSILANLFGWKRPDGMRRYREALVLVARKNGKTTFAAGIALYMLFCDNEPGAEVYSAAADRGQAALVFDQGAGMVRQEDQLYSRSTIYGGGPAGQSKAITLNDYSGFWKVLSADAHTKHGLNVHCGIVDELHAHPTRDLTDVIITGTGSRRQPLILEITTSDFDRESICNEKREYAEKVRDGIIEDISFLPVLFAAAPEDDWTDRKIWKKANPNLGVSVSMEYLARECQRAREIPAYENTFKRLHLNIKTEQATRWLPMDKWDECAGEFTYEQMAKELEGQSCFAGVDLATTDDLAACVLYFPGAGNAVLPFFWCPGENAHRRERRDRVPYETWARQGYIELTQGNVIDYDLIRQRIGELGDRYDIREIPIDRWNSTQMQNQLTGDGFEVVPFGQGIRSMAAPTAELERLVLSGNLRHGGHPVLRWMASNVAVVTDDPDNKKPSKKHSSEKIDGIVALIMALGRAMEAPAARKVSVYEDRGIRRL